MSADIAQIVRTTATHIHGVGIFVLLDIYFVESRVRIVTHPKHNSAHEFIMFYQFRKTDSMNFFPSTDHFFGTVVVSKLQQMW